ncbi:MAG TPA: hypothetical protein VNE16_06790 [Vicinamibacterales bacterium]|nr:hypothetical protein [Vicinamibacterales bacterium]
MKRYLASLGIAYCAYALAFLLWFVPLAAATPALRHLLGIRLAGVFAWTVPFLLVMAFITGPLLTAAHRHFGARFGPRRAALVGAALFPIHMLLLWGLVARPGDTLGAMFGSWRLFPGGDYTLVGWPAAAGAAAFAAWLTRAPASTRPAEPPAARPSVLP